MKRTIIFLILLGVFALPYALSAQEQPKNLYQDQIIKYTKIKKTGRGIFFGGVALTAIGTGVTLGSMYNFHSRTEESVNTQANAGGILLLAGIATMAGGTVVWVKGTKNVNRLNKSRSVSFNLNPNPNQILSLAYRF